ncbi:MAG TPA: response regulator [Anaeromyxobacteraceae bacterium]|nr:response regulator [Anaeromyxobacteraceae bacterium]
MAESRHRVLIIDDEELLIRSFARILGRDHEITALSSAAEALRRASCGETWDVILCDLQMPVIDGVEFFERLHRTRPDLAGRVAFVTGGAFTPRAQSFLERNTRPTAQKPVEPDGLRALVRQIAVGCAAAAGCAFARS